MAKSKVLKKSAKKAVAKKAVAKKAVAKKAVAKKAVAKKAVAKKAVAKKVPVKKAVAAKKPVSKKTPVKKTALAKKPLAKKAPAKKAVSSKKPPVKSSLKEVKSKILSKEEAIKKYKTSHTSPVIKAKPKAKPVISKDYDDEDDEFNLDRELLDDDAEIVDEAMGDEDFDDDDDGKEGDPRFAGEEFDPEDDEVKTAGSYSYGWGYNDAFDKPEDVDLNRDLDEDEEYALGKKVKPGEEDSLDDEDDY